DVELDDVRRDDRPARKRREIIHLASEVVGRELIRRTAVQVDALPVVLEARAAREERQLAVERLAVDAESARQRRANLVARRPVHTEVAIREDGIASVDRDAIHVELARIERAPGLRRRVE